MSRGPLKIAARIGYSASEMKGSPGTDVPWPGVLTWELTRYRATCLATCRLGHIGAPRLAARSTETTSSRQARAVGITFVKLGEM